MIKFASHHLLLYVVYMVPKIIDFYLCIQMLPAKCKWLHFSWPTLYSLLLESGHTKKSLLSGQKIKPNSD